MKKLLKLVLALGIFAILFFFIVPKQNSSLAACTNTYRASCGISNPGVTCCTSAHLTCGRISSALPEYVCNCAAGYTYNSTTQKCEPPPPTCSSLAPEGYTASCTTSLTVCRNKLGGGPISASNSCSGTTPICCSRQSTVPPPPPPPPNGGNNCEADNLGTCMPICSSPISGATGCTSPSVCCGIGSSNTQCPKCTAPYYYDSYTGKCGFYRDSVGYTVYETPTYETCNLSQGQTCSPGSGCGITSLGGFEAGALPCGPEGTSCTTAFGTINTDAASLVKAFFAIVLSISGGIAVLLIIISGYGLIASQGNPEKIKEAQERLTAAIIGLLFVIFAFSILKFIGVDILNLFRQ